MPLNETQQYGECHGLFRTSAEHLKADQAVPKKHNVSLRKLTALTGACLCVEPSI